MLEFNVKDLSGNVESVCADAYTLIFARFAVTNLGAITGLSHAFKKGKVITIGSEFFALRKETLLWRKHQIVKGKGVGLWLLTAYLPQLDDNLYFVHDLRGDRTLEQQFEAFLTQHTPYPVPPLLDIRATLKQHGELIPLEEDRGDDNRIAVYRLTLETIVTILERST